MWLDNIEDEYDLGSDDWFNWCRREDGDSYKEHRNGSVFRGL